MKELNIYLCSKNSQLILKIICTLCAS